MVRIFASAGLAEAAAATSDTSTSYSQLAAFLLLPCLFGLLLFLVLQRAAEFAFRPQVTIRELLWQTTLVACAITSITCWFQLFW